MPPFASSKRTAWLLAEFMDNRVVLNGLFGMHRVERIASEWGVTRVHRFYMRGLPAGADDLAKGFARNSSSINWHPVHFARPLSNLALGVGVDFLLGGLIQAGSDWYYYDLWRRDPELAMQRAIAGGAENATYGAIGTVGSVIILGGGAVLLSLSPPGWVFLAGAIVGATGAALVDDYIFDRSIHRFWFRRIDDDVLKK
jgi:hypothetical protein